MYWARICKPGNQFQGIDPAAHVLACRYVTHGCRTGLPGRFVNKLRKVDLKCINVNKDHVCKTTTLYYSREHIVNKRLFYRTGFYASIAR